MTRARSLRADHQASGATFVSYSGREVPATFSEAAREYDAARSSVAMADLSHVGKILFKGQDRRQYLNGQFTSDVKNLETGRGVPTCVLTPKGKLVADFILYDRGEDILCLQQPQATEKIVKALEKSIILSSTVLEDVSASLSAFHLCGKNVPDLLGSFFGSKPGLAPYACVRAGWGGVKIWALSYPAYSRDGVIVLVPEPNALEVWSGLREAGKPFGLERIGFKTLEVLRLESGTPLIGIDLDEDTLPFEAGLEGSISFTKGCYLGQETVARIKSRGHVNRLLSGLKVEGPARSGSKVYWKEELTGTVTSLVRSPRLNAFLALAMIRADHAAPGTPLRILDDRGEQAAQVVALPVGE